MKPSLETLAGLYAAALKQKADEGRGRERIRECITRHGYTEKEVFEEASRLVTITAGDYAMRPKK